MFRSGTRVTKKLLEIVAVQVQCFLTRHWTLILNSGGPRFGSPDFCFCLHSLYQRRAFSRLSLHKQRHILSPPTPDSQLHCKRVESHIWFSATIRTEVWKLSRSVSMANNEIRTQDQQACSVQRLLVVKIDAGTVEGIESQEACDEILRAHKLHSQALGAASSKVLCWQRHQKSQSPVPDLHQADKLEYVGAIEILVQKSLPVPDQRETSRVSENHLFCFDSRSCTAGI